MTLGVAGHREPADTMLGEQSALHDLQYRGIGPLRLGVVTRDQQQLAHLRTRNQRLEVALQHPRIAHAPHRHVRHRLEASRPHGARAAACVSGQDCRDRKLT